MAALGAVASPLESCAPAPSTEVTAHVVHDALALEAYMLSTYTDIPAERPRREENESGLEVSAQVARDAPALEASTLSTCFEVPAGQPRRAEKESSLEVSVPAVRDALRAELLELFGSRAQFQELLREEVVAAVDSWCRRAPPGEAVPQGRHADAAPDPATARDARAAKDVLQLRPESPVERPNHYSEDGDWGPVQKQASERLPTPGSCDGPRAPREVAADGLPTRLQTMETVASSLSPRRLKTSRLWRRALSPAPPAGSVSQLRDDYTPEPSDFNPCSTEASATSVSLERRACKHFNTVAMASTASYESVEQQPTQRNSGLLRKMSTIWTGSFEEDWPPASRGPLSTLVTSQAFENSVRLVILAHCAFMVHVANKDIEEPDGSRHLAISAAELFFLVVYFCEMVAKLIAYRALYFLDRCNCFECLLVCIDVWDFVTTYMELDVFSASYLSILRMLRLGRALRALRVARAFEKLQAFLICINGSLSSLGWSLIMFSIVLYVFSLGIVQIIAMHLKDSGDAVDDEARAAFEISFGSVQTSMLTLFQLSTDGSGWKESYQLVSQTGWIGSLLFLAYVSFTHISLINIITGIFVESAMSNLAPDRDSLALEHQFGEQQAAQELEQLFRSSCGGTDAVTKEEFDRLVKDGRLPRLLSLLGLRVQHARDFFKFLSSASPEGEVAITSFVRGCMKLKGSATSFDLHMLQVDVHSITRALKDFKQRKNAKSLRAVLLSRDQQTQTRFQSLAM